MRLPDGWTWRRTRVVDRGSDSGPISSRAAEPSAPRCCIHDRRDPTAPRPDDPPTTGPTEPPAGAAGDAPKIRRLRRPRAGVRAALTRSSSDKLIGGVSGGLGRYFGVDPILFRIAFVVLTFAGGVGVLAYIGLLAFVPADDDSRVVRQAPRGER